jgi:hypothetical protein
MPTFEFCLVVLGCILLGLAGVFCLITGLYKAAEFAEEHPRLIARVLKRGIASTTVVHVLCLVFSRVPLAPHAVGLSSQVVHWVLLKRFPFIPFEDPLFLISLVLLVLHQTAWVYSLLQLHAGIARIIATLAALVWPIPFTFLVSIASGDYVLPLSQSGSVTGSQHPVRAHQRISNDAMMAEDQSQHNGHGSGLTAALHLNHAGLGHFIAQGRRRRGQLLHLLDRLLQRGGPMLPMAEIPHTPKATIRLHTGKASKD